MKTLISLLSLLCIIFAQPALSADTNGSLKFRSMVDGQFIPATASGGESLSLLLVQSTEENAETAAEEAQGAAEEAAEAAGAAAEAAGEAVSETAEAMAEAAESAPQTMEEKLEALRSEMHALAEQSRSSAEEMVNSISSATSITEDQVYGIGVGIVVGALAADLMGFGGLATLAMSAGGGLLGNWIMSGHDGSEGGMEGEDLDDLAEELPETPTKGEGMGAPAKGEISL